LCYLWQITKVGQDEHTPENLIEQRNALVQQCKDYAIGELNSASEGVKRTAFRLLLDLHITAKARYSVSEDVDDALALSVQTQYRCAGFVQAEIERYAGFFGPRGNAGDDLIDENEDNEHDDPVPEVDDTSKFYFLQTRTPRRSFTCISPKH
jgi:cohesin complex subunit SA-1/2